MPSNISMLARNKKVIPIYFKAGDLWHTDVKLPDIVVRNDSRDTVDIIGVLVSGYAGGKPVVTFSQDQEGMEEVLAAGNQLLNKLARRPPSPWRDYNLHMLFGDVRLAEHGYAETVRLQPSSATCLRLNELFCFHYAGRSKVDEIVCRVVVAAKEGENETDFLVPLTPYRCQGDYIFPVRGSSTVMGTPWNPVSGHRVATSQEFAIDVVDFRRGAGGAFALSAPPDSNDVADYFLFEREVLSIGDGTVVAAGNRWPNEWVENPLDYSEERIVKLTLQLLEQGVEFDHAILGNCAIIDHDNGEFSLYAHLSQGTLAVEVGDEVHQGQVIGRVGNTSNSEGPHLHFHLMDSPDFQTANGLPVMFRDLPAGQPPLCDFKESNSLLYSDYLFVHVPE